MKTVGYYPLSTYEEVNRIDKEFDGERKQIRSLFEEGELTFGEMLTKIEQRMMETERPFFTEDEVRARASASSFALAYNYFVDQGTFIGHLLKIVERAPKTEGQEAEG